MSNHQVSDINIPMPWGPIRGRTYGDENSPPVLCVHGRADNLESFSHLIPLLPLNFYYVCIDLPGHGKSAHAQKGYILDLKWYTFCIRRVISHFKWTKLYYIGHSLGGQIGLLLAAMYPDIFLKLIVIDTILYLCVPPTQTVRALREYVFEPSLMLENRSSLAEAPVYTLLEFVHKMKETRKTEVTDEQIKGIAERNLIKVGDDKYKYSNDQRIKILGPVPFTVDQVENIGNEIHCPTIIILGINSIQTQPQERLINSPLKKNINITFFVIEGDHDVHLAHPHQVSRLIVSFLTQESLSKL